MRRKSLIVAVSAVLVCLAAIPALADVDKNPNAQQLVGVSCPDAGLSFETIWVPAGSSVAGHDLEGNIVGVAKSIYLTDPAGVPLVELFHRPGAGLDNVTVWCFWPDPASPTGFIGGDILFRSHLR
jgi:hypothetical protein